LLREPGLSSLLMNNGLLVLESAKRDELTVREPWERVRESIYGATRVAFLRVNAASTDSHG